jgi:hypothetical protein
MIPLILSRQFYTHHGIASLDWLNPNPQGAGRAGQWVKRCSVVSSVDYGLLVGPGEKQHHYVGWGLHHSSRNRVLSSFPKKTSEVQHPVSIR